ncbi:hypothetical protein RMN56_10260 [Micromonospora halotolerans]|uniref:Sigma-70 family RNA polymerase sigma factor n=1 Tax=Micromonospora halotolerans TaxID=709879 RepID=A0ABZ0A539_9ACTN|nr:hypothetical protein [Micromonospora halotolerans]WNM41691.1 hypothetical protein RMN56_10260 [Micromonospora halotolerans]
MSDRYRGGEVGAPADREQEIMRLISTGFFDGCVRMLGVSMRIDQADVEDAILDAIVRVLERDARKAPIEDMQKYLYSSARNNLRRRLKALARSAEAELNDGEHPSAEQEALSAARYAELVAHVKTWENARIRVVTLLYLAGIYEGDPLTITEVAIQAGEILGEEIQVGSIGTWRKRGFDRLSAFVAAQMIHEQQV